MGAGGVRAGATPFTLERKDLVNAGAVQSKIAFESLEEVPNAPMADIVSCCGFVQVILQEVENITGQAVGIP